MKKIIEGYIAREYGHLLFSNKPMHKDGFFGDGGVWYDTLEKDERSTLDLRVDMHEYLDIPELTFDESPRRCKLIIEIGEQLPGNDPQEIEHRVKLMKIEHQVQEMATSTGIPYETIKNMFREYIPEISEK